MLIDYGHITVPEDWFVLEKTPPGYSRVYYVEGGEVTYTDDRCEKKLKHNCLYIFPSVSSFSMTQNKNDVLRCFYMHLDFFPTLVHDIAELPIENNIFLKSLFSSIINVCDCESRSSSRGIIASLCDAFELYCLEKGILLRPVLEISNLLCYISEHISQGKITLSELSRIMGYNTQYFIRLFKRSVGMTPYRYITGYRLSESVKLLKQASYTVTKTAELVGYPDVKSFGRAFKEKYGVSPSRFRKIVLPMP